MRGLLSSSRYAWVVVIISSLIEHGSVSQLASHHSLYPPSPLLTLLPLLISVRKIKRVDAADDEAIAAGGYPSWFTSHDWTLNSNTGLVSTVLPLSVDVTGLLTAVPHMQRRLFAEHGIQSREVVTTTSANYSAIQTVGGVVGGVAGTVAGALVTGITTVLRPSGSCSAASAAAKVRQVSAGEYIGRATVLLSVGGLCSCCLSTACTANGITSGAIVGVATHPDDDDPRPWVEGDPALVQLKGGDKKAVDAAKAARADVLKDRASAAEAAGTAARSEFTGTSDLLSLPELLSLAESAKDRDLAADLDSASLTANYLSNFQAKRAQLHRLHQSTQRFAPVNELQAFLVTTVDPVLDAVTDFLAEQAAFCAPPPVLTAPGASAGAGDGSMLKAGPSVSNSSKAGPSISVSVSRPSGAALAPPPVAPGSAGLLKRKSVLPSGAGAAAVAVAAGSRSALSSAPKIRVAPQPALRPGPSGASAGNVGLGLSSALDTSSTQQQQQLQRQRAIFGSLVFSPLSAHRFDCLYENSGPTSRLGKVVSPYSGMLCQLTLCFLTASSPLWSLSLTLTLTLLSPHSSSLPAPRSLAPARARDSRLLRRRDARLASVPTARGLRRLRHRAPSDGGRPAGRHRGLLRPAPARRGAGRCRAPNWRRP